MSLLQSIPFCSFTIEEFQNNVQPCPLSPMYVFMSVPIMSNRAHCPLCMSLCLHVSTHNVQPCPTLPSVSLNVFMSVPIILLIFILKLQFLNTHTKNPNMSNFIKIIQVGAELFSTDGQLFSTDRLTVPQYGRTDSCSVRTDWQLFSTDWQTFVQYGQPDSCSVRTDRQLFSTDGRTDRQTDRR